GAELLFWLLVSHLGLLVLMLVAGPLLAGRRAAAPVIERQRLEPFAGSFVYFFALVPALSSTLLAVLFNRPTPVSDAAPLVVLSGLAAIVAAGDMIRIYRQRIGAL